MSFQLPRGPLLPSLTPAEVVPFRPHFAEPTAQIQKREVPFDSSRPYDSADVHIVVGFARFRIFVSGPSGPRRTGPIRHLRPKSVVPHYSLPQATYLGDVFSLFPALHRPNHRLLHPSLIPALPAPISPNQRLKSKIEKYHSTRLDQTVPAMCIL